MKVLLIGKTGPIGDAVDVELSAHGHSVICPPQSLNIRGNDRSAYSRAVSNELRCSDGWWARILESVDSIVKVNTTFADDVETLDTLVALAERSSKKLRLVYTGSCWLYGVTRGMAAIEGMQFRPPTALAWMVDNCTRLLQASCFSTRIIHPGMVYYKGGGAFSRFVSNAKRGHPIEIWGGPKACWPLVHRDDLAVAYRLLVEDEHLQGHFNVSAQFGVPVAEIAKTVAKRYGVPRRLVNRSVKDVVKEFGGWAVGPTLNNQMSSVKIRHYCGWQPKYPQYQFSDAFDD